MMKKLLIRSSLLIYFMLVLGFILPNINAFPWNDGTNFAYWSFQNASSQVNSTYYNLTKVTTYPNIDSKGIIGYGSQHSGTNGNSWNILQQTKEINLTTSMQNFTFSFWINLTSSASNQIVFSNRFSAGYYALFLTSKKIQFSQFGAGDLVSNQDIALNRYTHVVLTKNTTSLCVWLNGTLDNCNARSADVTAGNNNNILFTIGSDTASGGAGNTISGYIDEFGIWTRNLSSSEILELYNNGYALGYGLSISDVPTTNNNPANNTVFLTEDLITFNCSSSKSGYNLTNITLYINGTPNYTYHNPTMNYLELTRDYYLPEGIYNYSCKGFDNLSYNGTSPTYFFNVSTYKFNSENYTSSLYEGTLQNFTLNITISSVESINSFYFTYNNTQYIPSVITNGNNYFMYKQLNAVPVSQQTNVSFYWNVSFSSTTYSTSIKNQTVIPIGSDNCSSYNINVLNLTLKDEETQNVVASDQNQSIEVDIGLYDLNNNLVINFSQTYSNNSYPKVCIPSGSLANSSSYLMSGVIRYKYLDHEAELYHIQKYAITNSTPTNNIILYDLKTTDSTTFLITYKDENYIPVTNALVLINRKYVGEGVYKTVEIPLTDISGQAIGHFDTKNVIYSITFMKDGVILGTFDSLVVKCDDILTSQCFLNLNDLSSSRGFTDFYSVGDIYYSMDFNQATRTVTVTFSKVDGTSSTVLLNLTKTNLYDNVSVCSNSLTSSSGTFTCSVPSSYGNITFIASLYKDGEFIVNEVYRIYESSSQVYGDDGLFYVFLLVLTIPLMFFTNLIGMLVGILVGLIVASLLTLYNGGTLLGQASAILWIIISFGIIIYKMTQRNREGGY